MLLDASEYSQLLPNNNVHQEIMYADLSAYYAKQAIALPSTRKRKAVSLKLDVRKDCGGRTEKVLLCPN